MAGESPDKVERRESSGETTEDRATVASTDGKKSGKKRERKSGGGSDASPPETAEASGEARDEAADGASEAASATSAADGDGTEAEPSGSSGDEGAEVADEGAASGDAGAGGQGGGPGEDRLKAAVAAWVAGTDDEPDDTGQAGEGGREGSGEAEIVKDEKANSGAGEKNSSQIPAGELPVRPKSADGEGADGATEAPERTGEPGGAEAREGSGGPESAAKAAGEPDHPTAMFRTVRPGADDSAEATDGEEAARRAERMTAAFFGSGRTPQAADAADAAEGGGDAAEGGSEEPGEGRSGGPGEGPSDELGEGERGSAGTAPETEMRSAGTEPETETRSAGTATETEADPGETGSAGTVPETGSGETGSGEIGSAGTVPETGSGETGSGETGSAGTAPETGSGEARSVETDAGETGSGDSEGPGDRDAGGAGDTEGTAGDEAAAEARDESAAGPGERVDEPTAVFRAPAPKRPKSSQGGAPEGVGEEADGEARVDQPTAVFRAVEPGARDKGGAAGKRDKPDETGEPETAGTGGTPAKAGGKAEAEAEDADAKPAKSSEPTDPRVAAAQPGTDSGADSGGAADSGTAAETAKPDTGEKPARESEPEGGSKAGSGRKAGPEPESESERTSQFVPLRSADAPPRPKRDPAPVVPPMPEEEPAAGELPPEAEPERQLTEAELTRQQARPDQAPLDLLAQLTNTPPPPETPLRTAARRVKIWTPLVVLLAILFAIAQAVRPLPDPELSLSASPTYSFQGHKPSVPWPSEGQAALEVQGLGSLGSYGKQKPVPIASVAKVMTAYVILRDHPVKKGKDGPKIPVDKKAEKEAGLSAQNESTVDVKKGDTLSEREAIQAVMIASANNVARLLARWDAGSEKAFAEKMNKAAADLGMKDTKYTDPSGLTSSTVSTAADQVKLGRKAMGIDLFRETVRLPGYKDTKGDRHGNWNKLVPLDGVVGIKTGTTTKAGGNLLFAAEKRVGGTQQLIIGAVLGQYEPSILDTVLAKSKRLIDTAQDSLQAQKVVRKGDVVGYVDDQLGGKTPVVASRDVSAVGWSGLKVKLGLTDGGKALPHEAKAGARAGTLTVGDGPGQVRVPVTLKEDMTEPGFGAKLTRIL
ncbi:D-alanyl-D-alanine carboxypeptidase [Streptomyces sp. HNM0575]|uniref:D-alanyl-D-alanine carboxypeptidase n=1 Tax=Streptomyces sp. HNM0575 TaxID=2716338 RepID=UPI003217E553